MTELIQSTPEYWLWFVLAAILAIAEIAIAPGIFLVFIAIAAGVTGLVTLILPLSLTLQLAVFAILSLMSVYGGRYWYARQDHITSDPMLNDRAARMVGKTVTIVEAISHSGGRVRVGDGEWPARGPNMEIGETAKITAVENGTLILERDSDT